MNDSNISSTISAKYQIVIPKELRRMLQIKPGQKVYLSIDKAGTITIKQHSPTRELYGSMKGAWGDDSTGYIAELRAEADRDRT